jgi:hypothetical protein
MATGPHCRIVPLPILEMAIGPVDACFSQIHCTLAEAVLIGIIAPLPINAAYCGPHAGVGIDREGQPRCPQHLFPRCLAILTQIHAKCFNPPIAKADYQTGMVRVGIAGVGQRGQQHYQ